MTTVSAPSTRDRLGIARSAATGAAASLIFFVLCWIPAAMGLLNFAHTYITLYTTAEVGSSAALIEGAGWSLAFGAIAGVLVAGFYNFFAFLARR